MEDFFNVGDFSGGFREGRFDGVENVGWENLALADVAIRIEERFNVVESDDFKKLLVAGMTDDGLRDLAELFLEVVKRLGVIGVNSRPKLLELDEEIFQFVIGKQVEVRAVRSLEVRDNAQFENQNNHTPK